jgi:peptidoglycan/xylan/chitin deacetylase (PgdA/CDA1 family)
MALRRRGIQAVVHRVNGGLPRSSAKLCFITFAHHVASTLTTLGLVLKERCTRTIASILQGEKLRARDVLAEVEADIWSHWNLVNPFHVLLVLETNRHLGVQDASRKQITGTLAILVNHPWLRKSRIRCSTEEWIRANLASGNLIK